MSRKHLGMKRPIKQFDKAVDELIDEVNKLKGEK